MSSIKPPLKDRVNELKLPVVFSSSFLYPSTALRFSKNTEKKNLLESLLKNDLPRCVTLRDASEENTDNTDFFKIGTISSLTKDGDDTYVLSGNSRAEVLEVQAHRDGTLIALLRELQDIPMENELSDAHLPMMFGCIESIRLFLKRWAKVVPKDEEALLKKIKDQIESIEDSRREKATIYSLPWHMLVNFNKFFSDEFREKMLGTDKVLERLMFMVEQMDLELKSFQFAESFSDVDTSGIIKTGSDNPSK